MQANPVDMESFTPILKTVYLPFRKNAFPKLNPLMAQLEKGSPERVTYTGNDLVFDVKLSRRGGFSASALGYYPVSKIAREKQGRLGIARTYIQIAVDGLAVKAANSEKGAFVSLAKKVTEDALDQWRFEQNRIAHGDSRAIRAVIKTKTDNDTYVLHSPYGISGAGPGNLHLEVGDDIAIVDMSTFAVHGKAQITSISLSGDDATIEIDSAIANSAVGDFVVTAVPTSRHASDTSFGAEPYGIDAITDPSNNFATFEGISDDRWKAYATTATTVDEMTLMSFLNVIRARGGVDWRSNPKSMLLLTTTGIWQQYGESLLGLRRFNAPVNELKGGFKGVQVGDATLIDDPWAPRGRLYAIHTPDLIFIDLMDFGLMGYQDSPKWLNSDEQDKYTGTYGAYWNIGTLVRNTHGVITGITDNTNFSPVY